MKPKNFNNKIMKFVKKQMIINQLGGKCEKCGDKNIFHLVCHHIDNNKEFKMSELLHYRWSMIEEEIKKCQLLCENCHMEYHFNYNNNINDCRRKSKSIYLEYKNGKCKKCNYDKCDASLSFHHKDPNEKSFWIGNLGHKITTLSDIKEHVKKELDKCVILCRNCHLEEHTDMVFYNENKKEIIFKSENYKEKNKKINREDVFILKSKGLSNKDITIKLNCSKSTISDILRGRTKKDRDLKKLYEAKRKVKQ